MKTVYGKKSFISAESGNKVLQSIYFACKLRIISSYSNRIWMKSFNFILSLFQDDNRNLIKDLYETKRSIKILEKFTILLYYEFTCHDHSPRTLVVTFSGSPVNIGRASTPRSLFYCLFAPHICMVLFFTHIPFVVNHTINATPPERLQQYLQTCFTCNNHLQTICTLRFILHFTIYCHTVTASLDVRRIDRHACIFTQTYWNILCKQSHAMCFN